MDPFFNPFQTSVPFPYPFKTSGNHIGFLTFPGAIEMGHWLDVT